VPLFSIQGDLAVRKGEFASWEKQHGYNNDRFLKSERSRAGEFQIRRRAGSSSQRDVLLLSRSQWQERGRKVLAYLEPKEVRVTRTGHSLRLFSFDQTI
jgi:hypothetical protein